jgi:hypothetical protein
MAASNAQPFEVTDFSGGITDHTFDQSLSNRASVLDNFLIGGDRKPESRYGSEVDDLTNPEIPSGERICAFLNYANNDKLMYQSSRSIFYRKPSAFTELVGPTGNSAFSDGSISSVASFAQWNRHVYMTNDEFAKPTKFFKDSSGNYQLRQAGLPALATNPVVTAGAAGDQNFVYTFYYSYDYTVFELNYSSLGPTTTVALSLASAPDVFPVTITNIPVLTNGSDGNHDLSNIKVQIFRTTNDGQKSQKIGEVSNGTTSFVDNFSDAIIVDTGVDLYIDDGTLDFDPPPLHKYAHVVQNTAFYAHIKDSEGINPYKYRQSIPGVPDTAPLGFEGMVDDEITGWNSVREIPIVLCKKYVYRVEGFYDQFGRGSSTPIRISDNAGCISNSSCVQAEQNLFWFGNDGVYYSDGYVVKKISDDNNDFYKVVLKNTTQKNRIIGKFYEKERLLIWTIQQDSANQDNDSFLILDLKWGISQSSTFTTWSGKSFRPSALEIFNNEIYRGDIRGFTLVHKENLTTDKKIDIYRNANDWVDETIIWRILTINYNFGGSFYRKIPTRILLSAADAGNTTIQISAINDEGKTTRTLKPIRIRTDFIWRDDDFIWRVTDFVWRGAGLIEQWRRFPAKGLRLSYLQLEITNGFSDITNSDTLGLADFDNTAKTATLSGSYQWPLESEDYYISTESDGYVAQYLIDRRTSDSVLTILDPSSTFPNTAGLKWVIRGYKKSEPLHLLGFNVHWNNVSQTQTAYDSSAASTGENA